MLAILRMVKKYPTPTLRIFRFVPNSTLRKHNFCGKPKNNDDNKESKLNTSAIQEITNQNQTKLTKVSYPNPVYAVPLKISTIPINNKIGHYYIINKNDFRIKNLKTNEITFVIPRNDIDKIKSLDDFYELGFFVKIKKVTSRLNKNSKYFSLEDIKKVKIKSFSNGYVKLKEYGEKELNFLDFNQMDDELKELFHTVRNNFLTTYISELIKKANKDKFLITTKFSLYSQIFEPKNVNELKLLIYSTFCDKYNINEFKKVMEMKTIKGSLTELNNFLHFLNEPETVEEIFSKLIRKNNKIIKNIFDDYLKMQKNYKEALNSLINLQEENILKKYKSFFDNQNEEKNKESEEEIKEEVDMFDQNIKKMLNDDQIPPEVKKIIEKEYTKINKSRHSSETEISKSYLETIQEIPWNKYSVDNCDLKKAEKILNETHYGLKDVKTRILEFIATNKLTNNKGMAKVICLVGPPGTGKTSIVESVAKALNKKLAKFSLNGIDTHGEIKGHRRTYVGAMPGRIVKLITKAGTMNPVFLLDEIDKISGGRFGKYEISNCLLDILDQSQNKNFVDLYLDIPIDISKVLFICTANDYHNIPHTLANRLEIINLRGYLKEEKQEITKKYLLKNAFEQSGLKKEQIEFEDGLTDKIIDGYCREPGVRLLQNCYHKIFRKVAHSIVNKDDTKLKITKKNLKKFLGLELFSSDGFYKDNPVGVVTILSVSSYSGGEVSYIESVVKHKITEKTDKSYQYTVTGNIKNILSESIKLAFVVVDKQLQKLNISKDINDFLYKNFFHIHLPSASSPKDGPSAGINISTSLISLATNKKVENNISMTGELSLNGKVLKVGGIVEKTCAAIRYGVKNILMSKENKADFDDLDETIKNKINVTFVEDFEDVLKVALPDLFKNKR